MSFRRYSYLNLLLLVVSGCASVQMKAQEPSTVKEPLLVTEARQEAVATKAEELKKLMLSILESDQTFSEEEKKNASEVIEAGMVRYEADVVLLNQKKVLLMKELLKKNHDSRKISNLKNSIKALSARKTEDLLGVLEQTSKIAEKHPRVHKVFVERALLMLPLSD